MEQLILMNFLLQSKETWVHIERILLKEYLKGKINETKFEDDIALVSHAYFLSTLIANEFDENCGVIGRRKILNCEVINFDLDY